MSVCEQCARLQKTCCERSDVEVALTEGDIIRIRRFYKANDFYRRIPVPPELAATYENPDHHDATVSLYVAGLFDAQGRRPILEKQADGRCLFVTGQGCVLPVEARPLLCRLYPYDWNDQRLLWIHAPYCPHEFSADEMDLVQKIGDTKEIALNLVEQLYAELASKGEAP